MVDDNIPLNQVINKDTTIDDMFKVKFYIKYE